MIGLDQGIDMVEVSKFRDVFMRNSGFAADIFTEKERAYCASKSDPYIHFAGRFAVKEAALKALGIGMSGSGIDHAFQEIETLPGASGKPVLIFAGWVEKISRKRGVRQAAVSISHSGDYAVASVILVRMNNV